MSEKTSVFRTRMNFTLKMRKVKNQSVVELTDIYYQSIPTYGKQGTPAVISYPEDWFSKNKLYEKSGKIRWLNQVMKQNTIAKAKELLTSGDAFFK